jgi:hypothetical protein
MSFFPKVDPSGLPQPMLRQGCVVASNHRTQYPPKVTKQQYTPIEFFLFRDFYGETRQQATASRVLDYVHN